MKRLLRRPYVYWIIGIFLFYILLNIILSEFYITLRYIPIYLETINWIELGLAIAFTLIISSLVAANSVYGYLRFKERQAAKKELGLSCAASFGGLAVGVCPACVTGVFPLILSTLGVTFTWGSLPFRGIEIQILIIGILLTSLYLLRRKK